jgi:PTH1 family peptidyl-tRNA hydrolase
MLLIAGLGNPGEEHALNRHNIGFMAADAIARRHSFSPWRRKFRGLVAEGEIAGCKTMLLKPQTYMNLSGESVGEAMRFLKIAPADLLVIYDELDLVEGKVRIKTGGGAGGHNGIRSIDAHCGKDYRRLRLGIGHPGDKARVTGHVLGDFARADSEWLTPLLDRIADNAIHLAQGDDAGFMNRMALPAGEGAAGTARKGSSHVRAARPKPVSSPPAAGPMAAMLKKIFGGGEAVSAGKNPTGDLAEIRAAYADRLMAAADSDNRRLRDAFAAVPREDFLPPPPWRILAGGRVLADATANPRELYRNVLVAIDPARGINNGEPSLHAAWMAAVDPRPGDTICHVGAGGGYYTAILAELVGDKGRVVAYEIEADLAVDAKRNLSRYANARVVAGDAAASPIPACDILYVNAGLACPPLAWLSALKPGGQLVFPWRPTQEVALTLLVTRRPNGFAVRPLMGAWFIPLAGAGAGPAMAKAPNRHTAMTIRSLVLMADRQPDKTAIAVFDDLWFSNRKLADGE